MNYAAWISRVEAFHNAMKLLPGTIRVKMQIDPPLVDADLKQIRRNWHRHLPAELVRFWTEGSAHLDCNFVWTPQANELCEFHEIFPHDSFIYGGPSFGSAQSVPPEPFDTSDLGGDIMSGDAEACRRTVELLGRAILFMDTPTGDCLGLDPEASGCDRDDPPVVYLVHDDSSSYQMCHRFTTFLSIWEELCYTSPEYWPLDYWLDKDVRISAAKLQDISKLRRLLTPR